MDISTEIIKKVKQWCEIVQGLAIEREEKDVGLSIATHPPNYWHTVKVMDPTLLVTLESDMAKLQSEMHGRKRKEERKQINKAIAVREASREASREMGKVRRVIKSVLGTQTERYTITYIKPPEGRVVSDEEEIHNMPIVHFNERFAMPDYAMTSSLHVSESWHETVDSEEAFVAATETTGVPEHLRREVYSSLRLHTYPEAKVAMTENFRAAIASLPTNSAADPTGLANNMVKRWPLSVLMEDHRPLIAQWMELRIPEWWRWKWLAPLPKVEVAGAPAESNRCITGFDGPQAAGIVRNTT